jgi:ubiquitin carboxyl-terminal hydrolase 4/11/15
MEQLHEAICDLKRALLYLEKERHTEEQQRQSSSDSGNSSSHDRNNDTKKSGNSGIKKQCQRSLDRLQKEYDRQEKKNSISSHKKLRSQRKRDVLRLLLARHQNGQVLHGEAFYLLEWNWWVRWCRYVDFFDVATNGTKKGANTHIDNDHTIERTRRLLNYFPTGAALPLCFRKNPGDDEDDDSSDEEDDDFTLIPPGHIDNTELLATPDDVFFRQWYLPFPTPDNSVDGNNIDNNDFVVSSLRPNLIRGYHYEIMPREVYNVLRSWYGETTPSLCRRVTGDGKLMIYPSKSNKLIISCQKPQRCNACRAPGATSRCKQCMMVQYCDRACQESHWRFHRPCCRPRQTGKVNEGHELLPLPQIPFPSEGDLVGLNNLGNTCFMNSALQSLSHATPLTRHFLSDRFRSDLNKSNPLGTGGKLALAYEAFLKDVWMKQGITSSSPAALKRAIALFAPRFAGYQQHDAQEFLAFLLDGLHEDLNRIRRAPYVEMPDVTDDKNMKIAAAEAWNAHKRRNDSLVMDTFYGQFQSTCVCPRCDRVSVSFDTFNHVSLEIPSNRTTWATITIPVLVHFADGNRRPVRYGVTVRQQGFVFDLKSAVANLSQIIANKLILTDVYENGVYKLLDDKQSLSMINPNEDTIVAYEVTPYTVKDTLHMIVSHSLVIEGSSKNANDENQNMSGDNENNDTEQKPIGLPFMTSIETKNSTCRDLWELMCGFVRRIVKSTVDDIGETINGGISDDYINVANNCRLDDVLTVHIVDAQGRPRCIFEKTDGNSATNILPHESKELLSTILGDSCAENFLFLTLVWNSPTTYNEKTSIVINPNRFLDFDNHPTLVKAMREQQSTNVSATDQGITLHHCFQSFSKPERLDVDNMWYCSKCRQHVQALKTMKLWRLPNILVIHLKRFEFKHALRRDKLGTFVGFPLAGLDMNPHCAHLNSTEDNSKFVRSDIPADYDLFAVVNHYGRLGFGHYTAFAMQWDETGISKRWNAFDDSSVRPIQPSEVQSSAAYILFYRRRVFH